MIKPRVIFKNGRGVVGVKPSTLAKQGAKKIFSRFVAPIAIAGATKKAFSRIIKAKKGFDKDIAAQTKSEMAAEDLKQRFIKSKRKRQREKRVSRI